MAKGNFRAAGRPRLYITKSRSGHYTATASVRLEPYGVISEKQGKLSSRLKAEVVGAVLLTKVQCQLARLTDQVPA